MPRGQKTQPRAPKAQESAIAGTNAGAAEQTTSVQSAEARRLALQTELVDVQDQIREWRIYEQRLQAELDSIIEAEEKPGVHDNQIAILEVIRRNHETRAQEIENYTDFRATIGRPPAVPLAPIDQALRGRRRQTIAPME